MKVLLTTCLLFVLLPSVVSLFCYQCLGKKESCTNPLVTECAEDEDSCLNSAYELSMDGITLMTISASKTCVNSKYWIEGSFFIASEYNLNLIAKQEVCQRDLCNKKNIRLPRRSELPENGRECPACVSFDSDRCEAQNTISCRGNETKCLYAGLTGKGPEDVEYSLGLRGCTTPNFCKEPTGEMDMTGGVVTNNVTHLNCTNAPMTPSALEGFAPLLLGSLPFMGMKQRPLGPGN